MALDQSVLSELLDAFRTGEGLDLYRRPRVRDRRSLASRLLGGWLALSVPRRLRVHDQLKEHGVEVQCRTAVTRIGKAPVGDPTYSEPIVKARFGDVVEVVMLLHDVAVLNHRVKGAALQPADSPAPDALILLD